MKNKLTVGELITLEKELVGSRDQKTGATIFKGLLSQKLDGDDKYALLELFEETLTPNKKIVDQIEKEFIEEAGVKRDDGNYEIPYFIDKVEDGKVVKDEKDAPIKIFNPALTAYNEKLEAILTKEKEFEHEAFSKNILNFKAEEVYPVFNKLLRLSRKKQDSDPK